MEDFKKRLIDEKNQLFDKINKLHDFLFTQTFYDLDDKNKILLREQYKVMQQYYNILVNRLELILTEEDKKEI